MTRFLPGWRTLRTYERSWLRLDVIAGLTVAAMLVPQAMGYAALAGLAPQYGFYAAIPALIVYALVGSSRHLGVGPEPGTAVLAAATVGGLAVADVGRYVTLMSVLALLVAVLAIAGALLRLGRFASMLSRPVLVGYITGVGLTLVSSQLAPFTGAQIDADSFFPRFWQLAGRLGDVSARTLAVGSVSLVFILWLRRTHRAAPGMLIAVAAAALFVAVTGWGDHGVAVIGAIPSGFPTPAWPDVRWADITALLPGAAGIVLVGFTDNVLTARAVAREHGYSIDANQELFALGAINLAAGVSHGFPVSSSASRTVVPASLGSRTQLVSIVAAVATLPAVLTMRPLLAEIPRAALAAVILAAAFHIIDVTGFRDLWSLSRSEFGLAALTTLGVVVLGVLPGVLVAVGLSVAVALSRMARPHDAVLGDVPGLDGWVDIATHPGALRDEGLIVFRFDAPLFFLNIERFTERLDDALRDNPGDEEWLVIDCEGIGSLDASAIDGIRDVTTRLATHGVAVIAVARANPDVLALLRRARLLEPDGTVRTYATINSAVQAFRTRHHDRP